MKFKKLFVQMFGIVSLTGCAFRELAYRNAGFYFRMKIGSAFDTTKEQDAFLTAELGQLMEWHKSEELFKYDEFLTECVDRSRDGFQEPDVRWTYLKIGEFRSSILQKIYPPTARFLIDLNKNQLEHFKKYQIDANKERFEDVVDASLDDIQMKHVKKTKKLLESVVGKLSENQIDIVRNWSQLVSKDSVKKRDAILQNQEKFRLEISNSISAISEQTSLPEQKISEAKRLEAKFWAMTSPFLPSESAEQQRQMEFYVTLGKTLAEDQLEEFRRFVTDWKKSIHAVRN